MLIIGGLIGGTYPTNRVSEVPIVANTCQIGPDNTEYDIFVSAFDEVEIQDTRCIETFGRADMKIGFP